MIEHLLAHLKAPQTQQQAEQAYRLFHGRGQAYPGLQHINIDWLSGVVLITLFQPETETFVQQIVDWFVDQTDCRSIQCQQRYLQQGPCEALYGEPLREIAVHEGDLKFQMQLGANRNTGLFLDMRNGRQWVKENSGDKRVLNLFAYTCGFSVAAVAGRAKSVLNVDLSRSSLNIGRLNHRLNQQALDEVGFEKLDVFKSFGRFKRRGPFDLLICDPPTFQKGSIDVAKDYPKIIRRLDDFMAENAQCLLCLNSPNLNVDFLQEQMRMFAPQYRQETVLTAPKAFLDVEGKGLKMLCFSKKQSKRL